jgi:hypothetical protein
VASLHQVPLIASPNFEGWDIDTMESFAGARLYPGSR